MSKPKNRTPLTRKGKNSSPQPAKNPLRRGEEQANNPLLKEKTTLQCQVNLDFLSKFEAIVQDGGFESISEAMRIALRQFMRTEARNIRMMRRYMNERDGVSEK